MHTPTKRHHSQISMPPSSSSSRRGSSNHNNPFGNLVHMIGTSFHRPSSSGSRQQRRQAREQHLATQQAQPSKASSQATLSAQTMDSSPGPKISPAVASRTTTGYVPPTVHRTAGKAKPRIDDVELTPSSASKANAIMAQRFCNRR